MFLFCSYRESRPGVKQKNKCSNLDFRRYSHFAMKKQPLIIAFIACLSLSACQTIDDIPAKGTSFDRLKPPFDIAQRRAQMSVSRTGKITCKPPPPPVRDLTFHGFYRKGTGSSIVDHDAMRRYRARWHVAP